MVFRKLFAPISRAAGARGSADAVATTLPLEEEQRLYAAHGRAPVERHLDILLGDYCIGEHRFGDIFRRCMERTGTVVTPFNVFQRYQSRQLMCQYLLATLDVPGLRAECGVYRGASALLLCHALRSRSAGFDGAGMHLIDSFSGTSASVDEDLIPVRDAAGAVRRETFFPEGKTDTSADLVRGFFAADFPGVGIHAGWIPAVFASLPESRWAYVHVDVTLFEPTMAALEYFFPRLSPGGVILCDGSIFCPGAESAVRRYCEREALAYVVLGHREYVLIKAC